MANKVLEIQRSRQLTQWYARVPLIPCVFCSIQTLLVLLYICLHSVYFVLQTFALKGYHIDRDQTAIFARKAIPSALAKLSQWVSIMFHKDAASTVL